MLVKQNPVLQDTATAICQLTMDERIRMECEDREEFLRREATTIKLKTIAEEERDQAVAKLDQAAAKLDQTAAKLDQVTAERDKYLQLLQLNGIDINN